MPPFFPLSKHGTVLHNGRNAIQSNTATRKCVLNRDIPRSEYKLFLHLVMNGPNLLKCGHARSAVRTVVMRCVFWFAGDSEQPEVHERIAAFAICLAQNT